MPPSKKISPIYKQVLAEHRDRFKRVVVKAPVKLKSLYDIAQDKVARDLDRLIRMGKGDTFTAHLKRQILGQIRVGQAMVVKQLVKHSASISETTQNSALRGLVGDIGRLESHFTGTTPVLPIEAASKFYGIIDKHQTSLMRHFAGTPSQPGLYARYGAAVITKMEDALAVGIMTNTPPSQITDAIRAVADNQWWQAERICRTESAWAFNGANVEGMKEVTKEIPDMLHRWSEMVDDMTGEPLDNRVSVDSLAIHGQVTSAAGGMFTMPPFSLVPDDKGAMDVPLSLVGKSWAYPPNRPNDRATTMPWRKSWGIPAWKWKRGTRVPV